MRTWDELEHAFRVLCEGGRDVRLDHQHGAAGEYWRLAGVVTHEQRERFEALAMLAGKKILGVPAVAKKTEIVQEPEPVQRWYRSLCAFSKGYKPDWYGVQQEAQGKDAGFLFMDRLEGVYAASAALCLTLESWMTNPETTLEIMAEIPRYSGPWAHWQAATELINQKEPDYAKAAHEALSAVEGMARVILNNDSITLGEALKSFRNQGILHGALIRSVEGLWGYASDEPGVRHGAVKSPNVKPHEVRYVVAASEAALGLMLELDGGSG